jgi:hypothetical protein
MGSKDTCAQGGVYQSRLTTIYYDNPEQLASLAGQIRPSGFTRFLNSFFEGTKGIPGVTSLDESVDALFERVQSTLDMPLPQLRVNIRLYQSREELLAEYRRVQDLGVSGSAGGRGTHLEIPLAFYRKKTNTIYLCTEDVTIGILAHEMGHAVIEHYFVIRPPSKISEMLCQYVDQQTSSGRDTGELLLGAVQRRSR